MGCFTSTQMNLRLPEGSESSSWLLDVAMSISSALSEVHAVAPERGWKDLVRSGMNIGRDMVGTMTNTLILAFLGSGLTLQAVLPFSGPNVDADGAESDQLATIIVQNDGGMAVGAADITLMCEDGAELRFRVTYLPVGGSCYAFELNSAQYTGENRVCAASAEVEPDGSLSVDYRVSVMVQDGGLVLVNMTEDTLHNVTVRYRTDTGGTYFGGLSYTATVEELAPGASQTVLAAECYMGLPSVIAVSADES